MTESEAVQRMEELALLGDEEIAHIEADRLLVDFLHAHGFKSLVGAYTRCRDDVGFWYA
jgi:hypothetical protein